MYENDLIYLFIRLILTTSDFETDQMGSQFGSIQKSLKL